MRTTTALVVSLCVAAVAILFAAQAAYGQQQQGGGGPFPNRTSSTPLTEEEKATAVFGLINATVSDRFLLNTSAQALAAQDPQFKNFGDIWRNCISNLGYGNGTISEFQCSATFDEATGKWCGLEEYHAEKCAHTTDMVSGYGLVQGVFSTVGLGIFED